ncbi:NAD(P)H-quinone oxidoreductase [Bacillus sp. V5-8f]|uniref:NAD(P)H-quinone oxidoreductase n=1 Tax=Bacillus sp. V5-8f TaxID=2053044 RepID=UPI000C7834F8|nr:NAD(P)H-quinone oxidoreductase [Bacillus sp. V5-8f]PLT33324.1 NADPH:quinone oxidoreductase [Bacillus sp. V5-8f]
MKAILYEEFGGPEKMFIGECPDPVPKSNELLVSVKATALNRADLLQMQGLYPPPPGTTEILGLEMSGVIEELGSEVTDWKVGDRIFALLPGGGYAEKVTISADLAMPIPAGMSFEQAAAIAEVFLTAYLNLCKLGGLKKEQVVLIHAGASGVGTAAIQLVKQAGAKSIITVRSKEKVDFCMSLGADFVIQGEGDFAPKILEWTEQRGVDLILDCIGAPYWRDNLASIALDGKIIVIGAMGGGEIDAVPLWELIKRRISVIGSSLRSQTLEDKIQLSKGFATEWLPKFETGELKPVVDQVYDWGEVTQAHKYLAKNKNTGKVILKISR